jgi:uncharacterized membrane protein YccC
MIATLIGAVAGCAVSLIGHLMRDRRTRKQMRKVEAEFRELAARHLDFAPNLVEPAPAPEGRESEVTP